MKKISGKKAVITGGAMGIGFMTAKRLLDEGCEVTIWDMNEKALADAKNQLQSAGRNIFAYPCDITDKDRVFELSDAAITDMGQVDILVNNAGHVKCCRFCDAPIEIWERETDVNLISMYYTIYAFLPGMYERNSGNIVNISSASGLIGTPNVAVYSATKWGVYGLTESLRFEAALDKKTGVHFSSVHPGTITKGMFEGAKVGFPGSLLVPNLRDHDMVAKAIVEQAVKRNRRVVKRPWTLHLAVLLRGILPDALYGKFLLSMGLGKAMEGWVGREGCEHAQK